MSPNIARSGWYRWVFDHFDLPAPANVLDAGAGTGAFWRANAERLPQQWGVTCLDLSPAVVRQGRKLARPSTRTRWTAGDVHHLPFAENTFDAIVVMHVLAGTRMSTAIGELHRVLSDDGTVYATSSGPKHIEVIADCLAGLFSDVSTQAYASALRTQEIEPLAETVATGIWLWPGIESDSPAETRTRIADVLEAMGTLDAHRDDCLIVATGLRPSQG